MLVEGVHEETDLLLTARSRFQAPEVDGKVLINDIAEGCSAPEGGTFGRVIVEKAAGYDLVGKYCGSSDIPDFLKEKPGML